MLFHSLSHALLAIILLAVFVTHVVSLPTEIHDLGARNDSSLLDPRALAPRAPDFWARVLPLGASIVWGLGSESGNS